MDDDDALDPEVEAPETPETQPAARSDADWRKLQQENRSLRSRLRRTEIEAKHGKDVAELIPDEVPLTKWDEYADKLAAKIAERPVVKEQTENAEAPAEEPTPEETRLAAAADTTPAPSSQTTGLSARELGDLMKTDPAAAVRAMQAKYGAPDR